MVINSIANNANAYSNPLFVNYIDSLKKLVRKIHCGTLATMLNARNTYIIDIREQEEIIYGMIEHAIHLPKGILERDIEKIVKDTDSYIILYCAVGARSVIAANSLQVMGYKNVLSLVGGYTEWLRYLHNLEKNK